ncbi:hypothetical protein PoB_000629700 [Plakobranchus ocellatus]|uniref:Uncharacterized protein n=1 Tax=Plakobranchus ocellatus TaxID=259542 RepID=A0AAV3YCG2_9GAST|nr:hypothetical protein PoB_000629700 [Plakobranchus ocellatus]
MPKGRPRYHTFLFSRLVHSSLRSWSPGVAHGVKGDFYGPLSANDRIYGGGGEGPAAGRHEAKPCTRKHQHGPERNPAYGTLLKHAPRVCAATHLCYPSGLFFLCVSALFCEVDKNLSTN